MLRWLRLVALAQLRCGGVHQGSARLWRGTARNAWHDRDKLHSRIRPHNDAAGALLRRVQRHRRACIAPASNKTAPFGVVFIQASPCNAGTIRPTSSTYCASPFWLSEHHPPQSHKHYQSNRGRQIRNCRDANHNAYDIQKRDEQLHCCTAISAARAPRMSFGVAFTSRSADVSRIARTR